MTFVKKMMFAEMPNNPMECDRYLRQEYSFLGKRGQRRLDGLRKASGTATYTRDISLPGMLYQRLYTSPYPNARIVRMDSSRAESLVGVRAVLRYDDPEIANRRIPTLHGGEEDILAQYCYFQGQQMGCAVVADNEDIANEALQLLDIEWEERPFYLEPKAALAEGAQPVRPEWFPDGNKVPIFFGLPDTFSHGDVEQGFREADRVIEFSARRRYHGCPDVEMVSGITKWEGDAVELWLHHQHPYEHKWVMNQWFNVPMSKVKINAPYNGGMFGGWNWIDYGMVPQYICALMAKRLNRPVKWLFNRRDEFTFGSLDAMESEFKVGFKNDGTITAVKMKSYFENLSYEPALHFLENTKIPNLESESVIVRVNKGPTMAIRCEQLPPAFSLIHVFNHVAAELEMDPTELAVINDGADGQDIEFLNEYKRTHGFPEIDSLKECIARGKKAIGWDEKYHPPASRKLPDGRMHGLGFIWDHEWDDNRGCGAAALMIQQDGTVNVITLRSDIGLNAEGTYCAVIAEELGMKYEDVFLRQQDDTHLPLMTPDGSCNLTTNAYVMKKLAKRAKEQLLELACTTVDVIERETPPAFPGCTPLDLEVKDSVIFEKANPANCKTVREVVRDVHGSFINKHPYGAIQNTTHDPIYAWAYHRQGRLGKEEGRQRLCRQAHFCEVAVDTETGEVEVLKVVNVNDVGKALTPECVEGQMYGGTYMGIGRNRSEEFIWDPATGVLLNGNLIDYKFASFGDVGPIDTVIVESGMGLGAYGTVGIGEDVGNDITFVMHGAVYNAIGKWVDDGPITPDKILKALNKA